MRAKVVLLTVALSSVSTIAYGYSTKNAYSDGCHERITSEALRAVRLELGTAGPMTATADELALIDDLQFDPDDDMMDLGAVTLLLGLRDNDLKGRSPFELSELTEVAGAPDTQPEHCLRGPDDDEPNGTQNAIAACHAFIRTRTLEALEGLGPSGHPDPGSRSTLTVELGVRGQVDAPLPLYYVKIGQAIHALQDAFSHSYRTADGMRITVVLNWYDYVHATIVESKDGPPHRSGLDVCDDADALLKRKRELATEATAALLRVSLDPNISKADKAAMVDAMLETYVGFEPGCTFANNWCNAPEAQYPLSHFDCGCTTSRAPYERGASVLFLFLGACALRRLGSGRRGSGRGAPAGA